MYDYLLQFFEYRHLPPHLQEVSEPFHKLAHQMVETIPPNPERSAGLRKLLEAKDCAVRAKLFRAPPDLGTSATRSGTAIPPVPQSVVPAGPSET